MSRHLGAEAARMPKGNQCMQRAGNQSRCFEDVKATRLDRDLGFIHATLCSCMCWLQADRSLGLRLIRASVGELAWPVTPRTKRSWHSAIARRVKHGCVALAARCGCICVIAAGSRCCQARDSSDRSNGKASARRTTGAAVVERGITAEIGRLRFGRGEGDGDSDGWIACSWRRGAAMPDGPKAKKPAIHRAGRPLHSCWGLAVRAGFC